jgi:ssDNA-binding Zn-finger/Zn-ribbon topoisomerase 1
MGSIGILAVAAGMALFLYLVKKLFDSFSGESREEQYRRLETEIRREDRQSLESGDVACPLCGSPTRLVEYPHIKVHRCVRYPECRGFVRARSARRPKFARDWDRKKRKQRARQ